jgi:hypothetical protein
LIHNLFHIDEKRKFISVKNYNFGLHKLSFFATASSADQTKPLDHIKLPSLLESEDSELDDTLEDIWIRGKFLLNRKGSAQRTMATVSTT